MKCIVYFTVVKRLVREYSSHKKNTINDDGESLEIIVICWAPQLLSIWDSLSCHLLRHGTSVFCSFCGKAAPIYLNLTKVRPLFTLSQKGSDNSPLLIVFSAKILTNEIVTSIRQSDILNVLTFGSYPRRHKNVTTKRLS